MNALSSKAEPSMTALVAVESQVKMPLASLQLASFNIAAGSRHVLATQDSYWLDFCLTTRPVNIRARYSRRWGTSRFVRVGALFACPPGEPLEPFFDTDASHTSLLCQLHVAALEPWFGAKHEWNDHALETALDVQDTRIRSVMQQMAEELRFPSFGSTTLIELLSEQLAIELGRYCKRIHQRPLRGGLAAWQLHKIDERCKDSRSAPSLTELASLCRISVRHLTRAFRVSRDCSLNSYIGSVRINQAKQRLLAGEQAKTIAMSMGFSSPSSFSYAFRKATGNSPGQFQRGHRK